MFVFIRTLDILIKHQTLKSWIFMFGGCLSLAFLRKLSEDLILRGELISLTFKTKVANSHH